MLDLLGHPVLIEGFKGMDAKPRKPGLMPWMRACGLVTAFAAGLWAGGASANPLADPASATPTATVIASSQSTRFQIDTGFDLSRMPVASSSLATTAAIAQQETSLAEPLTSSTSASTNLPNAVAGAQQPVLQLGPGDAVSVRVFGRPEFDTTSYVGDDQRLNVPLAGAVKVGGLSPSDAANAIAAALREGQFLIDPQVSVTLDEFRSQQVSVLGEVRQPGRFPLQSQTSVLDMLALAGGVNDIGADVIYLMRRSAGGEMQNEAIDLKKLVGGKASQLSVALKGGDSIYVPRAEQFYVYGEVRSPNMYRLEPGTTVVQAIARSGGLTPRGSDSRIEIRRKLNSGKYESFSAELTEAVQPDDVIRVKERIF